MGLSNYGNSNNAILTYSVSSSEGYFNTRVPWKTFLVVKFSRVREISNGELEVSFILHTAGLKTILNQVINFEIVDGLNYGRSKY